MEERPGLLLHQLMRAHHNACMAALTARGVGDVSSPRLLIELSQYPDDPTQAPTQRELADRVHSAPPTVAAALKRLEREGFVERRVDEADSRRNRISITQKGRDAILEGMRAFQQVDDHMYHGFSPEERELVRQLHQRMLENLYQIGGKWHAPPPQDPCGPADGGPPPPPPQSNERMCDLC